MSDTDTDTDETSEDLQKLWKEALEQCEQVERLYTDILHHTSHLQESLSEDDSIMVTYQGIQQDLIDVLDSIHAITLENASANLSPILLDMLESCEFKTSL